MKKEFLEGFGLSEEVIEQILAESELDREQAGQEGEKLKSALEAMKAEFNAFKTESAVERELGKLGARNFKAVRSLLDMDALSLEEDSVVGLSEQLEKIKEENGFLFDSSDAPKVVSASSTVGESKIGFNFTGVR